MNLRHKKKIPAPTERRRLTTNEGPRVFSYYARGSQGADQNTGRHITDASGPLSGDRLPKRLVRLPGYCALAVIVLSVLYSCTLQASPKVAIISNPGTVHRNARDYELAASAIWRQSILNLSKLTVQSAKIRSDILAEFGELSDVTVELPLLGRRPRIVITPMQPALQFISANGAFYVDKRGKVMVKSGDVEQNQLHDIPLIRDETGIKAEPGKYIISESQAVYLQRLTAQLKAQEIPVESINLPARAANEADVRLMGLAYSIKFSTTTDARQAVGAYVTVRSKLEQEHVVPKEYIDVRVEEKVYYR